MQDYLEAVSEKKLSFPSEASAGLFVIMCLGIDEYRKESYRYQYSYPKPRGKRYEVSVTDYGE